jgi:hypothetical protein
MKKRCLINNSRGYFFLIDSVIALGVLAVGTFLIFTLYVEVPSKEEPVILSDDIMNFFANNKIKDIDNEYASLGGTLWQQGKITNADYTLLQQVAEFYKNNDLDTAGTFIEELTRDVLPYQYRFEFWVDGQLLYPDTEQTDSKNAAKALIPSKKIVYGISNKETGEMFGPYNAEVLLWQ